MKRVSSCFPLLPLTGVLLFVVSAAAAGPTGFPFTDEDLNYTITSPGKASLGEAHLHARHSGASWNFEFVVDAGIPGYQVTNNYRAEAGADFCTASFDRRTTQGARKTEENETVDHGRGMVSRVSKDGGQSEIQVPDCVKDALTYLFYAREEMGQGRVPTAQKLLFGGLYEISPSYTGAPMIPMNGSQVQTDELVCTVKGPSASITFEIYFARDAARTPLLIKLPLAMGTFSMELTR
jgi:Protein of unknown function (DUF3108)